MGILFHIKANRVTCLLSGHICFRHFCWLLSLDWWLWFEYAVPSLSSKCHLWCPILDPQLTTYQTNIGVSFSRVSKLGMSTLAWAWAWAWAWAMWCLGASSQGVPSSKIQLTWGQPAQSQPLRAWKLGLTRWFELNIRFQVLSPKYDMDAYMATLLR